MLIIAPDVFRQQGHLRNRKHVVVVVVGAKSDCAARLSQGGDGRAYPSVRCHGSLVRNDGAGVAKQRNLGIVDVPGRHPG